MSIEAMKEALEALKQCASTDNEMELKAIASLRQAIADAETKPVKVSVNEFMMRVEGNEDLIGKPFIWTEWPTKK
jgi:bacterioferritin (cytochrome b1)